MPRSVRQLAPWIALVAIVLGSTRPPSRELGAAALNAVSFSAGDMAWQCAPATPVAPLHARALGIERFRSAPAHARALRELAAVPRWGLDRPPLYVLHGVYRV